MKKWFLIMTLTGVLALFVAGYVTAANGGMGWMLPTGTPPPDDSTNIGLTESELAYLTSGKWQNEKPPLTEQQKASINQEIQSYKKVIEEGVFYKEKDDSGRGYWPGSAYGGIQSILAQTLHKWVAVRFTGDDSVRVFLMPPSADNDIKELRKDLIKAAKIAFQRLPELERIEFDFEEERRVSTTRKDMESVPDDVYAVKLQLEFTINDDGRVTSTTRKDMESVSNDARITDQDVVKLLKEHFDLSQFTTLVD